MSLKDKAASVADEGELAGFIQQLKDDGRFDKSAESICELRRKEIREGKGWR
jgi:hypothetical protein